MAGHRLCWSQSLLVSVLACLSLAGLLFGKSQSQSVSVLTTMGDSWLALARFSLGWFKSWLLSVLAGLSLGLSQSMLVSLLASVSHFLS